MFFFFQAEDGIRDSSVTGVQTCALPIYGLTPAAHLKKSGIDAYAVQVSVSGGREAIWGSEGTAGLEAEVLLDGDLVGFVPEIPGSEAFDERSEERRVGKESRSRWTAYH